MNLSDLVNPIPTNEQRDAEPMAYGRRDTDKRWEKYPQVRVQISGGTDLKGNGNYGYLATLDDGSFITGSNYQRISSARARCERRIKQGVWQQPAPKYRSATRAEALGPIGQPEGALAEYLKNWDEEHAS